MDFQANWQRISWRVCCALIAAAACICFVLIGGYISQSYAAAGYLQLPDALYAGTLVFLAAACLLLALGCATSVPVVKYGKLLVAGFVLGAVSAGISVISGVMDAAEYGLLAISGAFGLLVYLLLDIGTVAMCIILMFFFLGKAGRKAARWASGVLLLINIIYALSVILYYTGGDAGEAGLLYPWSNILALATMAVVFVLMAKLKKPASGEKGRDG